MNDFKTTKRTIIASLAFVVWLLLTIFYHHIDKYLTGPIFIFLLLLIPTTLILIVVYAIKGVIQIYRERKNLTFRFCLPTIIAVTVLIYLLLSPWHLDSEDLESEVEFRACYEGTQNQAYIKFRADKTFEINSTGVFFSDDWYLGHWLRNGDTIFFKFDNKKPRLLSDTVIISKEYLIPIAEFNNDSLINYNRYFYLGYCKGLN